MPLAFASILSSSVTLISTSTNLVVSGLITQYGMAPLGMYELAPVGIPVFVIGLIYMYYIGIRLIPDRAPVSEVRRELSQRIYMTEIVVRENSPFVGKTLGETKLGEELNIRVMRIVRQDFTFIVPTADMRLEPDDVLLVECERSAILKVKDIAGIDIRPNVKFANAELEAGEAVVEVMLLSGSPFIRRTLRGLHARDHYRLQVLAVNRHGAPIREKLSGIRFQLGDVLLVQGDRLNIAALEDQNVFRVLDAVQDERPDVRRAPRALLIFGVVLVISAFDIVPLPVAALIGAVLAFVTRCITPEEAYRLVEWKAIILVGSMLALGKAMEVTGTAEYLAQHMTELVGAASPLLILMAFFALTVALTPLSHSAAAIVMLPIAIRTAGQLGLDPRPFVIAIAVAATNGYLTPLDQVSVMVYGPGHYRFTDFLKVGALLTAIIFAVVIFLVPLFWPLT
jgi:di/tricarboxylate transporter